jgi:hypothetical protein
MKTITPLPHHSDDVTSWWSMGWFFYWTHVKHITNMVNKKTTHWVVWWLTTIDHPNHIGLAGDPSSSVPALSPLLAAGRSPVTSHQLAAWL